MPKTIVYIDGFNLYYGCLRRTPYKWLDIGALCRHLLPHDDIIAVNYYTALVSARPGNPSAPSDQQVYLRALRTVPNITITLGHFLTHSVQMTLTGVVPVQRVWVDKTEEKGSDVNLATHLVRDASRRRFDVAVLMTNDSDLAEPVRVVREDFGLPVGILNPHQHHSVQLKRLATFLRRVRQNELPALLRGWFGPDAGAPGTAHRVVFQPTDEAGYRLHPIGGRVRKDSLVKWRVYAREEIPPLFGLEFSEAHWNQGHVSLGGHQFLLVSLEKTGQVEQFQYADRFISPTEFEWQSQNRATQSNSYGLRVKNHRERGEAVHLFVRRHRKQNGGSAPFIYCGEVEFKSWTGEKPITVRWRLKDPVPQRLWAELKVPSPTAS